MNILKYKTTVICRFVPGTLLQLDDKQADRRRSLLDKTDTESVYLTKLPVEFKVGEVIGVDPNTIDKGMLAHMDELPGQAKAKPAKEEQKPKKSPGRPKGSGGK